MTHGCDLIPRQKTALVKKFIDEASDYLQIVKGLKCLAILRIFLGLLDSKEGQLQFWVPILKKLSTLNYQKLQCSSKIETIFVLPMSIWIFVQ